MKKGIMKALVFCLLASMAFALCACGLTSGGTTDDPKKEQQVGEKKIELAKAVENYDQKTVKRIDATADATFSFYLESTEKNAKVANKKDINAKVGVTRVVDDGKYYDKAELLPNGKADDSVIAIFNIVKDQGESLAPAIAKYVDYIIDFLKDKISAYAEMGVINNTYNLKAEYKNTGSDVRTEDVWCVFNAQSAAELAGIDIQADVFAKTFLSESLLGSLDLTNATDNGPKRVNAEGVASYDLKLDVERFTGNVAQTILNALGDLGVQLDEDKAAAMDRAMKTIKKWITVSADNLKATVNKDQLPQNMQMKAKVNIDIEYAAFRDMMKDLATAGFMEMTQATNINRAVWILQGSTRSSDNQEGYIGLELAIDLEEKFSYEQAKCDTTKQDKDLYVGEDQEVEGRINLVNEFKTVTEAEVNKVITKILEKYEVEAEEAETIVAEVIEELDFSEKVTVSMVLKATVKVCLRHELELKADAEVKAEAGKDTGKEKEDTTKTDGKSEE